MKSIAGVCVCVCVCAASDESNPGFMAEGTGCLALPRAHLRLPGHP